MTAQLILANGYGVAIASDSAVTMGGTRTYETAEKIHPLDDPHRLAVLHCGSVLLLGMPVGVLIDQWKASLGSRLQSVEGYRDSFLIWLGDNLDSWSSPQSREMAAFVSLGRRLWNLGRSVREHLQEVDEPDPDAAALRIISETNQMLEPWEINDRRVQDVANEILNVWSQPGSDGRPSVGDLIDEHFDGLPRSTEIDREINRYIQLSVEGGYEFPSHNHTTVTFVGYGQKEMFPAAASVRLFGAVGSHVARYLLPPVYAEHHGSSCSLILPLAQRDVIDQVLTGLNTPLTAHAAAVTVERLGELHVTPDEVRKQGLAFFTGLAPGTFGDRPEGQESSAGIVDGVVASVRDEMMADLEQASRDAYLGPAYATVAGMPLTSLAEAAGSLVAVQNLSLEIHGELPTVGGNIDVASITLNRGFDWINHKGRTQNPHL